MDTALYFPYMRVPQSAWFSRILLYWDQAATIMPGEVGSSNQVTPYMRDLRAHRLLEFVDPERVVDVTGEEFAQRFLTMVDADDISVRRRNQALDRVHSGKLSWTLFTELRDRGLASQETGPHELWFRIERRTAGEYMAYLAGAIAGARPETYPVTDDAASLEFAIRPTLPERLHDLRYALIEHALPAPS